jgi:MoaA/NifB/PqqE/SkfB family radical SAM enzyme
MKTREANHINVLSKIAYDEDTDKFSKFILGSPFSVCYKITQKCNYNCGHCIAASNNNSFYGLKTEEVKEIFKKIKDANILRLDITGGEPYIREDINELISFAISLGLEVVITSNGSLFKQDHIDLLSKHKIFTQISLDGPKEINDRLRGTGSFDTAIAAIKRLQDADVPVRINCTIQQINQHIIDEMVEIAKNYKIENLYFIIACAQGRASKFRNNVCLNDYEEVEIRKKILSYKMSKDVNVKMLDFKQYSKSCVLIETNGDFIAQSWDENDCVNTGNIFNEDMNDLWMNSNAFDHTRHLLQYIRHPLLYV